MKRQAKEAVAIVYAYGCVPPAGSPCVLEERDRMVAMWNALVDLDRECDRMTHESMMGDPEYRTAHEALDAAWDRYRAVLNARNEERAKTRQKATTADEALRSAVAERKAAQVEGWKQAKRWRLANKARMDEIRAHRKAEQKKIRQVSGLYWANYNDVMDRYNAAYSTCLKRGRKTRHIDPNRDGGCLAVQFQSTKSGLGAAPSEVVGGGLSMLRIEAVGPGVYSMGTTARTRGCRTWCDMRVDAAGHVVRFPVWLHRPLPENGRIKAARLTWKRRGEKIAGKLCLTVSMSAGGYAAVNESSSACGVDLGWRLRPDGGLLAATVVGTDGETKRVCLDARWMAGMDQVERLSSHIDDGLLEVAAAVRDMESPPAPITEAVAGWRPGLGARHVDATALHAAVRLLGFDVPAPVLHWYRRYRHLLVWRDNLRAKLIGRRREVFRLAAREIARSYRVIGIEKLDLAKMARVKKSDFGDNELFPAARAQRVRACVHEFANWIRHQARKHGAEVVEATSYTTMRCRDCGQLTKQKDRSRVVWMCEKCGAVWDQDVNAAGNLMAVAVGNASGDVVVESSDGKSMGYDPIVGRKADPSKTIRQLTESVGV